MPLVKYLSLTDNEGSTALHLAVGRRYFEVRQTWVRGGPAMNRVGLAANGYKSGELESVNFFAADAQFLCDN